VGEIKIKANSAQLKLVLGLSLAILNKMKQHNTNSLNYTLILYKNTA
jgi:hypothetical protein